MSLSVNDQTLLGLVGHPVSHSLSPALHNAALSHCGISGEYKLFDIEESALKSTLSLLIGQGLSGFNVTIPHKTTVYDLVDQLTPEAVMIGAVNTIKVDSAGHLLGYNTDALGFRAAVEHGFGNRFDNKTAFLLGYGGSAKAVLVALSQLGFSKTYVLGRNQSKLQAFVDQATKRMNAHSQKVDGASKMSILPYKENKPGLVDLIVNTVPFGMGHVGMIQPEPLPAWVDDICIKLPKSCNAVDLVYQQDDSLPPFALSLARRGLVVQDGIEMLVQQARASFEIWTEQQVPVSVLKSAIKRIN